MACPITQFVPRYATGEPIDVGDRVLINQDRKAMVSCILLPGSLKSIHMGIPDGGICVTFEDGDCWVWSTIDEDMELIAKK